MFGGFGPGNLEAIISSTNNDTDDPDKELLCSFTGPNIMVGQWRPDPLLPYRSWR